MDAKSSYPQLSLPTGMPSSDESWLNVKLLDPRAKHVLEKMAADLKPNDPREHKLTGAMILKEFLAQRLAPLPAHSHHLWNLKAKGDHLRLRPASYRPRPATPLQHGRTYSVGPGSIDPDDPGPNPVIYIYSPHRRMVQ